MWDDVFTEKEKRAIKEIKDSWKPNRRRRDISLYKRVFEKCVLCDEYAFQRNLCHNHHSQYCNWVNCGRKFKRKQMIGKHRQWVEYERWRKEHGYEI